MINNKEKEHFMKEINDEINESRKKISKAIDICKDKSQVRSIFNEEIFKIYKKTLIFLMSLSEESLESKNEQIQYKNITRINLQKVCF